MTLLWNGDLSTGNRDQYGDWEWGGTFDGTPPLDQRLVIASSIDGYSAPAGQYMWRVQVQPGDQYGGSTGWRCLTRQANPIPIRQAGYDSTFVWCGLWPAGWPGDANVWLSGMEVHHTGGSVAPHHFMGYSNNLYVDLFGGNDANKTTYLQHSFLQGYAQGAWYVFVEHYLHNLAPNGQYQLWWGRVGVDSSLHQEVDLTSCGTMYSGFGNYILFGHYRAQTGTGTTNFYQRGMREYSSVTEAIAYATSLLGGAPPTNAPTNTSLPLIGGELQVGNTLTTTDGVWSGSPTSYAYQWQYTRDLGATWIDVSGATGTTFQESSTFSGALVRVKVTATNSGGSATVNSSAVGPIVDAPVGFAVRIKAQDTHSVTIEWDHVPEQEAFLPLLDGSETLSDGKRHPNTSQTQNWVKIGRPSSGGVHSYGVKILGTIDEDSIDS